jgi:hypothetical protein
MAAACGSGPTTGQPPGGRAVKRESRKGNNGRHGSEMTAVRLGSLKPGIRSGRMNRVHLKDLKEEP